MTEGITHIDDEKHTIKFENPQLFDPEKVVYMYEFDSEAIPLENLKYIDERQSAVVGINELKPRTQIKHKAGEITKYYELTNWKPENKEMQPRSRL